jgi:hypothetical protein
VRRGLPLGTSPELVGTLETLKLRSRQEERRREKTERVEMLGLVGGSETTADFR